MQTQILEGTLPEIERRLRDLTLGSNERLRVVVMSAPPPAGSCADASGLRTTEYRNGVPLLPYRQVAEPIDLNLVRKLLDEEDLEFLGADRVAGCERPASDDGSTSRQP